MLKGKQGRFRQNLLGKRVDYSGRSVIVVGPELLLDQCGLPKEMAMKLFKPFVIGKILQRELAHNVKAAERLILDGRREVWDILEEVIHNKHVLLNRAPTLHRLGIQAFRPTLIEGKAIQLHPLVCAAFNADFDGDQMAVHVPLSDAAQEEAANLMSAAKNLLKPSAGDPIITPTQDMVLGCHFLTSTPIGKDWKEAPAFANAEEAKLAEAQGIAHLRDPINVRMTGAQGEATSLVETTVGRLIFNEVVPLELGFVNSAMTKNKLSDLIARSLELAGPERTVVFTDAVKHLGFVYATASGISISASDILVPPEKAEKLKEANELVDKINTQYWKGWITADERYRHAIRIWSAVKSDLTNRMIQLYQKEPNNHIAATIHSGARGNWGQVAQLAAMKGLVANPGGKTIELPIQSNLKEGFSVLEFFIATHGGRKGKSDTALKTAEAGYLTRRLVDAVQDFLITEVDCGSKDQHMITREESEQIGEKFEKRIFGRTLAADVLGTGGEVLASRGDDIDANLIEHLKANGIKEVAIRSVITCETEKGLCAKCYGRDLSNNKTVQMGTPVGIIAAQSIGEPGTQLTMRTFHMGGVAEGSDITQGLTRVEELFEARPPKTPATLSDISGTVKVSHRQGKATIQVMGEQGSEDTYGIPPGFQAVVAKDQVVKERCPIAKSLRDKSVVRALIPGTISIVEADRIVVKHADIQERTYELSGRESLLVKNGQTVEAGQPLNAGHFNLHELLAKKGIPAVQRYIVSEVQHIYASQGQTINDKHLEIIAKKMFSKLRVL
ncbi:MAG: DNA-directed RNA polymerase subunit beta', partial [Patescibacteria group bacterium]